MDTNLGIFFFNILIIIHDYNILRYDVDICFIISAWNSLKTSLCLLGESNPTITTGCSPCWHYILPCTYFWKMPTLFSVKTVDGAILQLQVKPNFKNAKLHVAHFWVFYYNISMNLAMVFQPARIGEYFSRNCLNQLTINQLQHVAVTF